MLGHAVNGDLVRKFFAAASANERQVGRIAIVLAVLVDTAEHLSPGSVGLHARSESQDSACGRVDIQYVAVFINNDHAIVDVAQD